MWKVRSHGDNHSALDPAPMQHAIWTVPDFASHVSFLFDFNAVTITVQIFVAHKSRRVACASSSGVMCWHHGANKVYVLWVFCSAPQNTSSAFISKMDMHKVAHIISRSHLIEPTPSARVDHRKCDRRWGPEQTYKQTHTTHQTGYETVNSYLSLLLIIVRYGPPRKSDSSLCHFIVEQSTARESEAAFRRLGKLHAARRCFGVSFVIRTVAIDVSMRV